MEISGGSYWYIQLKYSFPDVNNIRSVFLQISCNFVMWSVGQTRFKENTTTDLPSIWTPWCNKHKDILHQRSWPAHGGQSYEGSPRPTVGSPWLTVGSPPPTMGLSGLAFLIQLDPISWCNWFCCTVIYRHSPQIKTYKILFFFLTKLGITKKSKIQKKSLFQKIWKQKKTQKCYSLSFAIWGD